VRGSIALPTVYEDVIINGEKVHDLRSNLPPCTRAARFRASYHVIDSKDSLSPGRVSALIVWCVQPAGAFYCAEGSSWPMDKEREKMPSRFTG
jgi:hypothetical protein